MYYLIIWDKTLAATGHDGAIDKLEIPTDLARTFMHLDSMKFPSLSGLSFDDYDLFSDAQLDSLIRELLDAPCANQSATDAVRLMVKMIIDAKSMGKGILFDPFRND